MADIHNSCSKLNTFTSVSNLLAMFLLKIERVVVCVCFDVQFLIIREISFSDENVKLDPEYWDVK